MKSSIVLVLAFMSLGSLAEKSKGRKSFFVPSNSKLRKIDVEQLLQNQNGYEHDIEDSLDENIQVEPSALGLKPDSSSGRLFFKKFFLLGKKTPTPQFIIITQNPTSNLPSTSDADSPELTFTFTGNVTTSAADDADGRGGDLSDDYSTGGDDEYEDEIADENPNPKKKQHTNYKLAKGKGTHQQQLSFVVPSKYMRNSQNKRNPSAPNSNGGTKVKKFVLSNNNNVKRKRTRNPVRRFIVKQN